MRKTAAKTSSRSTRMTLAPHQVILRPLVTEKGVFHASELNQYAFEVNPLASKPDIRSAIEHLFDVRVTKVRTQARVGKPRRHRFREGLTKAWKKAIITLDSEHRINFF
jgi:large subunit ribosomal protein L23